MERKKDFRVSLRLSHPTEPLVSILKATEGVTPGVAWSLGDGYATGDKSRKRKQTYWTWPVPTSEEEAGLADVIERAVDFLDERREFVTRFCSTGGRIDCFVGVFADPQVDATLNCGLLARMADLHVDLSLDMYAGH